MLPSTSGPAQVNWEQYTDCANGSGTTYDRTSPVTGIYLVAFADGVDADFQMCLWGVIDN